MPVTFKSGTGTELFPGILTNMRKYKSLLFGILVMFIYHLDNKNPVVVVVSHLTVQRQ